MVRATPPYPEVGPQFLTCLFFSAPTVVRRLINRAAKPLLEKANALQSLNLPVSESKARSCSSQIHIDRPSRRGDRLKISFFPGDLPEDTQ